MVLFPLPSTSLYLTALLMTVTCSSRCNTSHFLFAGGDHRDYVQYEGLVPEMTSLTACAWVRTAPDNEPVAGTLLSYCSSTTISTWAACETVHVRISKTTPSILAEFGSKRHYTDISKPITTRSHLCVVKSTASTTTYINGSTLPSTTVQNPDSVQGSGVLILGQSQHGPISGTGPGEQRYIDEGFHGETEGFTIWARALKGTEILGMYESDGCYCTSDAAVTFDRDHSIVPGKGVAYNWTDACKQNE